MARVFFLCLYISFLFSCHDTTDHNIKGPARDTTSSANNTAVVDTTHHFGTISGITDRLTHDLKEVKSAGNEEGAFIQMFIIHRRALLDIAHVEMSVGNLIDPVRLSDDIIERSQRLLNELSHIKLKDTTVRKPHQLQYNIPISERAFDQMIHTSIPDDQSFLQLSIIIERSEILLARSYLKAGKDAYLRKAATALIQNNQKEISRLAAVTKSK
ncbi:MAG: hypothetical protein V4539_15780 [Bacteroidota bacterium]|jgi:uncharacterized protein (DUF305 family)|nr:MAG: hypothetical protein EPO58_04900 [Chitinophagaceae bacterium]